MCNAIVLLAFCLIPLIFGVQADFCHVPTKSCPCMCGLPGIPGPQGPPGPSGSLSSIQHLQLIRELTEITCSNILRKGITEHCPATSCKAIYDSDKTAPSGLYWVRNATGSPVQVFCQMSVTTCGDISGGWMRVAYINMTDQEANCPDNLFFTEQSSKRMCR